MVRSRFLLASMVVTIIYGSVGFPGSASAEVCTRAGLADGSCPRSQAVVVGPSVDLVAGYTTGSTGVKSGDNKNGAGSSGGSLTLTAPRVCANGDPAKPGIKTIPCGNGSFLPFARPNTPAVPCTVCSPSTIVRVSDLQNFPAYAAPTGMEPNGWAIVGLATNFWADASAQIGEGLLLGEPAQVMFTPLAYHWDYGDGSTDSSPTGGASWKDLGLAEFTNTLTSHKYAAKGTYTVSLTVDYRADYSFGDQGWRPVEGTVSVPSASFTVVAAKESTVLVAQNCNANPRGPGC